MLHQTILIDLITTINCEHLHYTQHISSCFSRNLKFTITKTIKAYNDNRNLLMHYVVWIPHKCYYTLVGYSIKALFLKDQTYFLKIPSSIANAYQKISWWCSMCSLITRYMLALTICYNYRLARNVAINLQRILWWTHRPSSGFRSALLSISLAIILQIGYSSWCLFWWGAMVLVGIDHMNPHRP